MKHQPDKHLCKECGKRRAVSSYWGEVKWRKDHPICRQCYRRVCNAWRVS